MPNKIEIRNDKAKFDLVFGPNIPEYYTDGLAQILIGPTVSKVMFYSSSGIDDFGVEERNVSFKVSIPTNALIELAKNIVNNTLPNRDMLIAQAEVTKNSLIEMTGSLKTI